MNGVHDMGGMHGFGPVLPEANEPVFHAAWEGRVRALSVLMGAWRLWNIDAGRHSIERLPPADYLRMSYFEKWLEALVNRLLAAGLVTPEELASGRKADGAAVASPPVTADMVTDIIAARGSYRRDVPGKPRFAAGDRIRAKNIHPEGHTRLPRYVRGRLGVIERDHGAHVFPDSNARFAGEAPRFLYTVRFTARELWGNAGNAADAVSLDLWEDYLDPA
ncbi:MAG TPA: nitrile hydratase subunit beta [Acetobacteraceae bacterium]|nr:nitrile hydratase subunit beta [Acetobacteraceae bacterium]